MISPHKVDPVRRRAVRFEPGPMWLLANPTAGRGRAVELARSLRRRLTRNGWSIETCTRHPAQANPSRRPNAVAAVGGDGTLRAVVSRLLELYPDDPPPVLPVPLGTANLMGQYLGRPRPITQIALEGLLDGLAAGPWGVGERLGLQRHIRRAVRIAADSAAHALLAGKACRTDVATADGRPFLLMAGVGFDAHVVQTLDARRTGPIGLATYALPTAHAVAAFDFPAISVRIDGRHRWGPAPGVVMIANVPHYGTGFPLVPEARADDGLLDVLCLPCANRLELLKLFTLAALGTHVATGTAVRGRHVQVTSSRPVPVQIDGDPGGHLPLDVQIRPAAIPLVRLDGKPATDPA